MIELDIKKDGNGNIIILEDSFEMLLSCLDKQKFVGEQLKNGDSLSVDKNEYWKVQNDIQNSIDYYNRECRKMLHQKYILNTIERGYFLTKRYEHQNEITPWSGKDVGLVYELFKDTRIEYKKNIKLLPLDGSELIKEGSEPIGKTEDGWFVEPEPRPWLIERPLRYDYDYLTISEDGHNNRPWTQDEVDKITELING
jgi:hypothetical protein